MSISFLLGENNYKFLHDPFYEGIFSHVSVSVHCIFPKKCFRLKCIFIKLSVSSCFPIIIKAHPRKKTDLYSVFGSVIAV